jgi:hypothetical protein
MTRSTHLPQLTQPLVGSSPPSDSACHLLAPYCSHARRLQVRLVHAVMEKADVIHLTMDVARFRYKPGQYLYLSCPSLGTTEWHPFTITSAPEQMHVTVHIRTRGDWTRRLMEHVCPSLERQASANGSKRNFTTILSRRNSMSGDDHLHPNSSHKGIGLLKGTGPDGSRPQRPRVP